MEFKISKEYKEVLFDFERLFIQGTILNKIGLGMTIGNDGLQIIILCFYFGITPKNKIW
jgi:hypothetical protein